MLPLLKTAISAFAGIRIAPRRACSLCGGTYARGPLKGEPLPPCLACRDAVAPAGYRYDARGGWFAPVVN